MTVTAIRPKTELSKVDSTRERELYRYYQPSDSKVERSTQGRRNLAALADNTLSVDAASSPDTTLTALAQLCALRLNASRAMVSVIGKEIQYFIAESTKSLNLIDNQKSEVEGDGLWIGCTEVQKEGRLCEKTIELAPVPGRFPCFTVTDLTKDSRFNQLPFVTGPPFFKFYAGTPLTTKKGINIGSLFIVDTVVRPVLNTDQQEFLGSVAQIVMGHMEVSREAQERRKVMRMSRGLNAFVEGKDRFDAEELLSTKPISGYSEGELSTSTTRRTSNVSGRENAIVEKPSSQEEAEPHTTSASSPAASLIDPKSEFSANVPGLKQVRDPTTKTKPPAYRDSSQSGSEAGTYKENKDTGYQSTFVRAAKLLRQSLDLHSGGVVFFDTTTGFRSHDDDLPTSPVKQDGTVRREFTADNDNQSPILQQPPVVLVETGLRRDSFGGRLEKVQKLAEIISFSTSEETLYLPNLGQRLNSFSQLGEDSLQYLLHKYPGGKLWSFDEDGSFSSSEEEVAQNKGNLATNRQSSTQRKLLVAQMLQGHFPSVRQLLFAPLWDSGASRWFSGCFVFSPSSEQMFSPEAELNFVTAFNNSVMAEVSRLASVAADRQKGDFIGSISHELRSPLHGILASAEFLSETESDAFQDSLVNTILSCGRTLLDTIDHILDFSKINSFERNWRNAQKPGFRPRGTGTIGQSVSKEALPLMNIFAITNVAAVAEEVIEGVYAGQIYQNISSSDMTNPTPGFRNRRQESRSSSGFASIMSGPYPEGIALNGIEVILDIAPEDFTFTTQPGALRRIIMNLFGNALKYTTKGTITVQLALCDIDTSIEVNPAARVLEIKIKDTGKGISSEYLRTKLYTPFCQEDTLASGTGLGLSLVRSIVNMLGGSIAIRSQVGAGTEVTICLPLLRASEKDSQASTPSSAETFEASHADSINALRADYSDKTVALYGMAEGAELARVIKRYIYDWFGLKILSSWSNAHPPDVIMVDEQALPALSKKETIATSIVVICSNSSNYGQRPPSVGGSFAVEYLSKPFGPYKLAKALRLCLENARDIDSRLRSHFITENILGESAFGTVVSGFQALALKPETGVAILSTKPEGIVTATGSINAQMVVGVSPTLPKKEGFINNAEEYPFPGSDANLAKVSDQNQDKFTSYDSMHPKTIHKVTESPDKPPFASSSTITNKDKLTADTAQDSRRESITPIAAPFPQIEKRPPRLLLVDDNSINLRLLETYMRKRKHKFVDSAENGQLAVQAAERQLEGYDIIFMDMSMPVMNGFEATRAIREIERDRGRKRGGATTVPDHGERASLSSATNGSPLSSSPPALIIALTGLASSRDQSEAFASGIDLFLTKPVSFKEVGRLLDNWELHRGREESA